MKIWAIPAPISNEMDEQKIIILTSFISTALKNGVSLFGWLDEHPSIYMGTKENLIKLVKHLKFNLAKSQFSKPKSFLQKVNIGDWVVHINVPKMGFCTAAKVIGKYEQNDNHELDNYDLKHTVKIDTNSLLEFNRNNPAVLPKTSAQLKYRGNHWMINDTAAFLESICNLKIDTENEIEKERLYYLKQNLPTSLSSITEKINAYYPKDDLKHLMVKVFENVPSVSKVEIKENTLVSNCEKNIFVTYKTDNEKTPITQFVLINIYEKDYFDISIKEPIEQAIATYKIDTVLVVDINNNTPYLKENVSNLSTIINKKIDLLAGMEVGKFILKHCPMIVMQKDIFEE